MGSQVYQTNILDMFVVYDSQYHYSKVRACDDLREKIKTLAAQNGWARGVKVTWVGDK